ncbi:protein IMPACT isoform X2 [Salvelinus namaycush]|uniref:Protein IMPACT isoform X2 n=1 Tax=Salvelinus namaycush TaxID=8040 RepID=A0A8U1BT26_SALNM|nr:protein IMPACT isoform X2 [Salvelinus namaycush]
MANIDVGNAGDLQSQIEEVEALSSIYGDEWCVIDEAARIFCIKITDDIDYPKLKACLQIILPHDYPSAAPPVYQINAAWLRGPDRKTLSNSLEELYVENTGESILYLWVEKIREFLLEKSQSTDTACPSFYFSHSGATRDEELPPIKLGETITERRSTFQPHLAPVVTPRQVRMVLDKLFENKKIASATHNIYAYRIYCEEKQSFLQDCEDDGETAAGGRLLHLLQILDVRNVLVVVSRWYGGILLGPDRFKHINNSARNILVQEGYTSSADEASKAGGKNKKSKSKKTK